MPFPNFKNGVGLMLQLPQPTTLGEVTINLNSTGTAVEIRSAQTPTPTSLDDTTVLTPATTAEARLEHHQGGQRDADVERAGVDLHAGHGRRQEPVRHRGDHAQSRVLVGGLSRLIPSAANLCQEATPGAV